MENFLETIIKMLYDANWSDGCGRSAPSALVGKRGWRAVARQSGGEGAIAARRGQLTASEKTRNQKPETRNRELDVNPRGTSGFRDLVFGFSGFWFLFSGFSAEVTCPR